MASIRHLLVRAANADIAGSARQFNWDRNTRVPFLCECDAEECQAHVRMTLADYDALTERRVYITVPGHVVSSGMPTVGPDGFGVFASVA